MERGPPSVEELNAAGKTFIVIQLSVKSVNWNFICCYYIDEISKQKVALKILGKCFAVRSGKDYLSFIYQEYDVFIDRYSELYHVISIGILSNEVLCEKHSAPWVVLISPSNIQFSVVAEKQVLGEYPCLQDTVFLLCRLLCISCGVSLTS